MPVLNSKFSGVRFKQFLVAHDMCAMKINTDSIILGSWTKPLDSDFEILDIGSGSGVLSLMMAQQSAEHAHITGVETDKKSFEQSIKNSLSTRFNAKIKFVQSRIQHFYSSQRYHLIISNPPHFQNKSSQHAIADKHLHRMEARSQETLSPDELLKNVDRLLDASGRFCCVLPTQMIIQFEGLALLYGLYLNKRLDVHSCANNISIRSLLEFSYKKHSPAVSSLVIYDAHGSYSEEYRALCHDFYVGF